MKKISIVTACYNEADNVEELAQRIREVFSALPQYAYEHIFIDNASQDGTQEKLRQLVKADNHIKAIFNNRNFGHIRSPYYGMLQATGDAVISMASDLQDPPELITQFLQKWEEGFPVVVGQKTKSAESWTFFQLRKMYYRIVDKLADVELLENVTGFGLYDQKVIESFRRLDDPYPYVRGLISELGFPVAKIVYTQPLRKRGITKNNFYTLYDMAMLGITTHSKVPLRLATMMGFGMSFISFIIGMIYLVYKLIYWNSFQLGIAPLVIGIFFIASIQLFFIGLVGEYIGFIYTQVIKRPLVTEKERLNFDDNATD